MVSGGLEKGVNNAILILNELCNFYYFNVNQRRSFIMSLFFL